MAAKITVRTLRKWGFVEKAELQASEEGDGRVFLSRPLNPVPAVYAWGVGDDVVYVGQCESLSDRHRIGRRGVELPGKPQYCVAQLREALARREQVKLYAYTPERFDRQGMKLPCGLISSTADPRNPAALEHRGRTADPEGV